MAALLFLSYLGYVVQITLKGLSTGANKAPFFSADFEKFTSCGVKLKLKKGNFSAPCRRSLRAVSSIYWIGFFLQ